jgi:histidine triad (HIT) family protein
MDDCIFCKIFAGEIPATEILRDEHGLAFMDIGPIAEGHVLLIPAKHYQTVDGMQGEEAAALLKHIPALVGAVRQATGAEGVNVLQNNGAVAHQEVPHVHFHIIPRRQGDAWHWNWPAGRYAEGRAEELAGAIRDALA